MAKRSSTATKRSQTTSTKATTRDESHAGGQVAPRIDTVPAPEDGGVSQPTLESLWFRLAEQPISTIAIVPVPEVTAEEAVDIAHRLAKVGADASGATEARVIDATGISRSAVRTAIAEIRDAENSPVVPTIIATDPTTENAATAALTQVCNQTVLLVGLEASTNADLETTVEAVGVNRISAALCARRPARPSRFARIFKR